MLDPDSDHNKPRTFIGMRSQITNESDEEFYDAVSDTKSNDGSTQSLSSFKIQDVEDLSLVIIQLQFNFIFLLHNQGG